MLPSTIVDEIVLAYGQLTNRRTTILQWISEIVREVEDAVRPPYMVQDLTDTTVSAGGNLTEITYGDSSTFVQDVFEVYRQVTGSAKKMMIFIPEAMFDKLFYGTNVDLFYTKRKGYSTVKVMFAGNVGDASATVTISAKGFLYTGDITSESTDVPALDEIDSIVLPGVMMRAAGFVKDMDRFTQYGAIYRGFLGQIPQKVEAKA